MIPHVQLKRSLTFNKPFVTIILILSQTPLSFYYTHSDISLNEPAVCTSMCTQPRGDTHTNIFIICASPNTVAHCVRSNLMLHLDIILIILFIYSFIHVRSQHGLHIKKRIQVYLTLKLNE